MNVLAIDPGAELAAWVAAFAGAYALTRQIVEAFRKNKREKSEINAALNKAPEVRQQLELGNVGAAINHLNVIIESQARDLQRRDRREQELEDDLDEAREKADKAEENCRARESDLEKERAARLKAEKELVKARRDYARSLAQLRALLAQARKEDEDDEQVGQDPTGY
jgi:chromosome segregation ATPase